MQVHGWGYSGTLPFHTALTPQHPVLPEYQLSARSETWRLLYLDSKIFYSLLKPLSLADS